MARRRRNAKTRTITRYIKKKARKYSKSNKLQMLQMDALIYGATRGYVSNFLVPITSKIPLGGISDEVGMGILNYFIAKNTSGMIKKIATKGLIIENAMLGAGIVSGGLNLSSIGGQTPTQIGY